MIYRIGARVEDQTGLTGNVVDSVPGDPPTCSTWVAFVEWDNGEKGWIDHDSLRPEGKDDA